jgi:signal transduction histidine kinase
MTALFAVPKRSGTDQAVDRKLGLSAYCRSKTTLPDSQWVEKVGAVSGRSRAALVADLVDRTARIVSGTPSRAKGGAFERLEECEARARELAAAEGGSSELRRSAAVEFLSDAVTALALDGAWDPGDARRGVMAAAPALDMSPGAAALAVFVRALGSTDAAQLPPPLATDFFLWLLIELGPADAASLWTVGKTRRLDCIAAAGDAPKTRRFRAAAAAALNDLPGGSAQMHAVSIDRWDQPFAVLVTRCHSRQSARLNVWLREAARALSPVFERETMFERDAARERELVSGSERRLLRLGYDLHDGPLQEVVALAEDLRLIRAQVRPLLVDGFESRVDGRFDDLDARLAALDRGLRDIALSVRPSTAVERPLEHALQHELESFARSSGITITLDVTGKIDDLTDSQRITLYRVAQEALANIRKHSGATTVGVCLRAAAAYVELVVTDDGCGFDVQRTRQRALQCDRLGLAGVAERVHLLGGELVLDARIGAGVVVRATLPRWRPREVQPASTYAVATA